jgi:hypothetical protein
MSIKNTTELQTSFPPLVNPLDAVLETMSSSSASDSTAASNSSASTASTDAAASEAAASTTTNETAIVSTTPSPEENEQPLPIPPPSMLSFTSSLGRFYRILPSDEEFGVYHDYESDSSDSSSSRSSSPSPSPAASSITELMNHITDTANHLAVPYSALDEVSAIVRGFTRNRDELIRRLVMAPPRYYTDDDVRDMRQAIDSMTILAQRTGVPPIAQHLIDFYLDTIVPTSRRIHPPPTAELVPPAEGEVLAVSTGSLDTEIIVQPAGAPPTFTIAAAT